MQKISKIFLTPTLFVRVDFYNGVAIARNQDADFKKLKIFYEKR